MKKILGILGFVLVLSCSDKPKDIFKKPVKATEHVEIINISGEFFSDTISLDKFKSKYPWFQANIPDKEYALRRKDSSEIEVYKEAMKGINQTELKEQLSEMFSRVKYYFPTFKTPKVYLYSSNLQSVLDPIFFRTEEGMLFVDVSAFMGEKNKHYEGLDFYLRKSMNPENLVPKISEIVAYTFVVPRPDENKFMDHILQSGKIKILQDAFLPNTPDYLKMDYTPEQQDWAEANEVNVWNYFVEHDMLFSDDSRLYSRFIDIAPFSKFYTEVDQKSSPRIGVFIGWKISKNFFNQKPDTKLSEFLIMNGTDIFNQSKYNPKD